MWMWRLGDWFVFGLSEHFLLFKGLGVHFLCNQFMKEMYKWFINIILKIVIPTIPGVIYS